MRPIDCFDAAAEAYTLRPALVDGGVMITFEELAHLSERIAQLIAAINGCDEPLPIAVCAPNDYRTVACTLGIMRAGAVVMPLHTRSSISQVARYLAQMEPRVVFYHSSVAEMTQAAREELNPSTRFVCLDGAGGSDESLDAMLQTVSGTYADAWADPFGNPNRPVYIRQTSGTTGVPKVIVGDVI